MAVDVTSARFSDAPGDGPKLSLLATFGLLAVAIVGLLAFVVYSQLVMPAPASLGIGDTSLPPTAASNSPEPHG